MSSRLAELFDRAATAYDAERRALIPCFDAFYGAALAALDGLYELGGFQQVVVGAGVQPGGTATHQLNVQVALLQVHAVEVGNFQLAAMTGLDLPRQVAYLVVIEVEAGYGVVGLRFCGLLFDADDLARIVKLGYAVGARVGHMITKHGGALGALVGAFEDFIEAFRIVDVVAQYQCAGVIAHVFAADQECLGQAIRGGLDRIGEIDTPLAAVIQQFLEQ